MNIQSMNTSSLGAQLSDSIMHTSGKTIQSTSPTQIVNPAAKADSIEKTYTREQIEQAVETINKTIQIASSSLEFSVDKDTNGIVVKIIDQETKQVLRQIPNEETMEIAKSLDKLQGLLIKQTA